MFLAMQYPVEVPGVSVTNFLRTAINAFRGEDVPVREFARELREQMRLLDMDPKFAERSLNEGFSGGEKKRHEILQMALLRPELAILDETDSGLDVDALRVVAGGVNQLRGPGLGILLITHYTRVLRYISPDFVHVMVDGRVVQSGGPELADELEEHGYERWRSEQEA
jgi:Fe-S cluster assembly ATP-binding protein